MIDALSSLLNILVLVFAVSTMLSMGLSYTVQQVFGPLRNARLVIVTLVASFVPVPLLGYAVIRFLSLDQSLEIGLFLVASAAGAPLLIKLTQAAGGDVALGTGLVVLLLMATIVYLPSVVPLALPEADVNTISIALPLVLTMLLPLMIGLTIKARASAWAQRLGPIAGRVSTIALVVELVVIVPVNYQEILGIFGTGAILAGLFLIGSAFICGYLLAGLDSGTQGVLGFATAQRNFAAAMVVAQTFDDPNTLVMVIVMAVVSPAILFPLAFAQQKRSKPGRSLSFTSE